MLVQVFRWRWIDGCCHFGSRAIICFLFQLGAALFLSSAPLHMKSLREHAWLLLAGPALPFVGRSGGSRPGRPGASASGCARYRKAKRPRSDYTRGPAAYYSTVVDRSFPVHTCLPMHVLGLFVPRCSFLYLLVVSLPWVSSSLSCS